VALTLGTVIAVVAPLASCSGDDDTASTTVPPPPTTSTTSTTPSTSTTSTTSTTPSTSTTVATSPQTSDPPPTTAPEPVDLAIAVERDWREGLRRFEAAAEAPNNPDLVSAALEYTIDAVRSGTEAYLTDLAGKNQRIIRSQDIEPTATILSGPERDDSMPFEVDMSTCEVDPFVVVEELADGSTSVVDDAVTTRMWDVRLRFDEGIWKLASLVLVRRWDGVTECAP
jgi:hypothetical protein